jgi:hypothetical protein
MLMASLQIKRDCLSEIDQKHYKPCRFDNEVETL